MENHHRKAHRARSSKPIFLRRQKVSANNRFRFLSGSWRTRSGFGDPASAIGIGGSLTIAKTTWSAPIDMGLIPLQWWERIDRV